VSNHLFGYVLTGCQTKCQTGVSNKGVKLFKRRKKNMPSLNKIMLIGHVGSDPEMRFTTSGKPVTSFRLATNRTYTQDGEKKEETEWHSIVMWGTLAENCNQYLSKGSLVYIEGRLKTRSWDNQEAQKQYRTEVIADIVEFLDRQSKEK